MERKSLTPALVALALLCLVAGVLSLTLGAAGLAPAQLWQALWQPDSTPGRILYLARMPRTAGCLLSGAALALSGCVIQGVLANPLASPSIIGVNAGAGLAVSLCCALGAVSGWVIAGGAFCGALAATALVSFCAGRAGASRTTVILSGVAVNTLLNGLRDGLTTLIPEISAMSGEFRVGGFSGVSTGRLVPAAILIFIAASLVLSLHNELDIMTLGEETAQGLGLPVRRMRRIFLALAALLAGASVSYAGLLGFVGLMVPHGIRRIWGSESRGLLPLSALAGAAFVTLADLAARLAFAPYELPVGIFLSVLGGPCFLWLLYRRRGGGEP